MPMYRTPQIGGVTVAIFFVVFLAVLVNVALQAALQTITQ